MTNYSLTSIMEKIEKYGSVVLPIEVLTEDLHEQLAYTMLNDICSDAYTIERGAGRFVEVYAINLPNIYDHYMSVKRDLKQYTKTKDSYSNAFQKVTLAFFEQEYRTIEEVLTATSPAEFYEYKLENLKKRINKIK